MNIYIQVYDSNNAFTIFQIAQTVTVIPDVTYLDAAIQKTTASDPYFASNVILHEGSFLSSLQELQKLASLLNERSLSDKLGLILNTTGKIKLY